MSHYYDHHVGEISIVLVSRLDTFMDGFGIPLHKVDVKLPVALERATEWLSGADRCKIMVSTHGFYCKGIGFSRHFYLTRPKSGSAIEDNLQTIPLDHLASFILNIRVHGKPAAFDCLTEVYLLRIQSYSEKACAYLLDPATSYDIPVVNHKDYEQGTDEFYKSGSSNDENIPPETIGARPGSSDPGVVVLASHGSKSGADTSKGVTVFAPPANPPMTDDSDARSHIGARQVKKLSKKKSVSSRPSESSDEETRINRQRSKTSSMVAAGLALNRSLSPAKMLPVAVPTSGSGVAILQPDVLSSVAAPVVPDRLKQMNNFSITDARVPQETLDFLHNPESHRFVQNAQDAVSFKWIVVWHRWSGIPIHAICKRWLRVYKFKLEKVIKIKDSVISDFVASNSRKLAAVARLDNVSYPTSSDAYCVYCKLGRVHISLFCPFFHSYQERKEILVRDHLCSGCLGSGCELNGAHEDLKCTECSGAHVTDACDSIVVKKKVDETIARMHFIISALGERSEEAIAQLEVDLCAAHKEFIEKHARRQE